MTHVPYPAVGVTASPSRPMTLPSLTGLRFFAAFAVFLFHVTLFTSPLPPHEPTNPFSDPGIAAGLETVLRQFGYVGVSFFFILSGFVITWATPEQFPVGRFMWRQVMKIYPPHVVVWAISLVLYAGAYTAPQAALLNLTLLHTFSTDPTVYVSVNPPSWSLSSDMLFYMLFPVLAPLVRYIPVSRLGQSAGLLVLGMLVVILVTTHLVPDQPKSPISPISGTQFWFAYIFPVTRMLEFIVGMVAARTLMAGCWPRIDLLSAGLALVASVLIAKQLPFLYTFGICYVLPLTAIITECAARDRDGRSPLWMDRPVMQWLGRVSFGFYLVQGVSIFWLSGRLGLQDLSVAAGIGAIVLYFCASLLGGWLLYRFVEEPSMRVARWVTALSKGEMA
ncbi:acyltransferase family protein [Pseudoroseicyclus aestuarii]|uniref:Peptidoglycan/LPS O-acetylase OafA/YrhL n=1 Tax=Pseudoroseicyclus aestuarii TaxID=1795041 RepID=A0A318SLZ6_9RHOB|nr:acyltransferase [Pseudoroseicyclus aestuarii]PYE80572.1 peptidoglycan/LPS O-acetylase OafA/YrhL [Pseudoroseicyclus aestuarii]